MKAQPWKRKRECRHLKVGQSSWSSDCARERRGGHTASEHSWDAGGELPFISC